jgi:Amino acid transporters
MSEAPKANKKVLGLFALAMINVAAVLSIRNYPSMAVYGWSCIGWYVLGAIVFLIPISLAGAELATGWPEGGGVYAWVKQAFGEKGGFVALFCEWSNNLVWFPTVLSFTASTLAFALTPDLAANPWFMFSVMMIVFWGTTAIAYFGEEASTKFSNVGVILGSIIPSLLIIGLGLWWLGSGQKIVIPHFTLAQTVPTINLSTLPFFATIVLLFAGMEMAGFHALETKNPQRDFPRAMALSAIIIVICTVLATLAIAIVIPASQLNLASGVMQAIQYFFDAAGIAWLVGPMALLITLGGVVNLAAWLIGPAKGLGIVAEEGNMPPLFDRTNKYGAPGCRARYPGPDRFGHLAPVRLPAICQPGVLDPLGNDGRAALHCLHPRLCRAHQAAVQQAGHAPPLQDPRRDGRCLDRRRSRALWHGPLLYRRAHAPDVLYELGGLCRLGAARHVPFSRAAADLFEIQTSRMAKKARWR